MFYKVINNKISEGAIIKHKSVIANASSEIEDLIEQIPGKELYIQLSILDKLKALQTKIEYSQHALKTAERVNQIKIFRSGSLTKFHQLHQIAL